MQLLMDFPNFRDDSCSSQIDFKLRVGTTQSKPQLTLPQLNNKCPNRLARAFSFKKDQVRISYLEGIAEAEQPIRLQVIVNSIKSCIGIRSRSIVLNIVQGLLFIVPQAKFKTKTNTFPKGVGQRGSPWPIRIIRTFRNILRGSLH